MANGWASKVVDIIFENYKRSARRTDELKEKEFFFFFFVFLPFLGSLPRYTEVPRLGAESEP